VPSKSSMSRVSCPQRTEALELETDAVVARYGAVRDSLNELFGSVRQKAPDANIVLLSQGEHEGFDYRTVGGENRNFLHHGYRTTKL